MNLSFVMNYENKFEEVRIRFLNCADFNNRHTVVFFKGKKVVGNQRKRILENIKRGNYELIPGYCCDYVGLPDYCDYFKKMYAEALKKLREGGDK